MLAGAYRDGKLDVFSTQALPHSLGLLYEDLTEHLGFRRSSDEYKVMAMGPMALLALPDSCASGSTRAAMAHSEPNP